MVARRIHCILCGVDLDFANMCGSYCRACASAEANRRYHTTERKPKRKRPIEEQCIRQRVLKRARVLRATYGLMLEEEQSALKAQDFKCKICKRKIVLHVDHDHTSTNPIRIRGWLCIACNTALGLFQENPDLLRQAASYLETSVFAIRHLP